MRHTMEERLKFLEEENKNLLDATARWRRRTRTLPAAISKWRRRQ